MALVDHQIVAALDGANHLHVRVVFDHRPQFGFVAAAAHLVEDHADDANGWIEGLVTEDQGCDAAGHALTVQHQYDWRVQLRGERGIAVAAIERKAVVQALVALDQTDVGTLHLGREKVTDLGPVHGVVVEIVTRASGGLAKPQGIDIVRPLLERLHDIAGRTQCGAQSNTERGFARRLVRGRDVEMSHLPALK